MTSRGRVARRVAASGVGLLLVLTGCGPGGRGSDSPPASDAWTEPSTETIGAPVEIGAALRAYPPEQTPLLGWVRLARYHPAADRVAVLDFVYPNLKIFDGRFELLWVAALGRAEEPNAHGVSDLYLTDDGAVIVVTERGWVGGFRDGRAFELGVVKLGPGSRSARFVESCGGGWEVVVGKGDAWRPAEVTRPADPAAQPSVWGRGPTGTELERWPVERGEASGFGAGSEGGGAGDPDGCPPIEPIGPVPGRFAWIDLDGSVGFGGPDGPDGIDGIDGIDRADELDGPSDSGGFRSEGGDGVPLASGSVRSGGRDLLRLDSVHAEGRTVFLDWSGGVAVAGEGPGPALSIGTVRVEPAGGS